MRPLLYGFAALLLLGSLLGRANAGVIPTLFNTGVDGAGNPLPNGAVDPHYSVSPGAGPFAIGNPASVGWVGNTATSQWISPAPDTFAGGGPFTYTTTFDLTGFNPSTAVITGKWATDDQATMFLNGTLVATSPPVFAAPWTFFAPFAFSSGFVAGVNTLTIDVPNNITSPNDGPTGMQIVFNGTATPEPATFTLAGLSALFGFSYYWRRRKRVGGSLDSVR